MASGGEAELLGGLAAQWPLVALLMAVAGLVHRIITAQHERHRTEMKDVFARHEADMVDAFKRLDAYAAVMVDLARKHSEALLPVASALEKLGTLQELRMAIREDADRRSSGAR